MTEGFGRRFRSNLRQGTGTVAGALFGDRIGLCVFLACLCFFGVYWRVGLFITDTRTVVQTLGAVADGHLWIDRVSGDHFQAPGAVVSDGLVYGRNYGQVVLSLPFLWLTEGLDLVADLRVGLTALWHLAALGLVVQLGRTFGGRRLANVAGSGLVLVSFLLNVALAEQFVAPSRGLLALQLASIVAGALLGAFLYRLVGRFHGRRTAAVAGLAGGVVLPVGFWAQIPKRHVFTGLVLVGILYAFARSRSVDRQPRLPLVGEVPAFRAGAYGLVGLLAWIHAAEAIFAFIPLVLVDLPTAPSNDRRSLAVVAAAFGLSLAPFLLTNLAIAGNPIRPPRALTPADATLPRTGGTLSGGSDTSLFDRLPGGFVLDGAVWLSTAVSNQVTESLWKVTEPEALYRTYVRSGSLEMLGSRGVAEFRAVNLSVLESVPLFGGLVGVLLAVAGRLRGDLRDVFAGVDPTDLLAVGLVVSFLLLYTQRLPIHVQVTVRYLLPIYPVGLYLLVRSRSVRRVLASGLNVTGWTYVAAVLVGTQLLLAYVVLAELPVAAAAQLHAVLGLVAAGALAVSLVATDVDERAEPVAAVALGLAAAAGTAFVLLSGMAYFSFVGEYVLPVSQAIADLVGRI